MTLYILFDIRKALNGGKLYLSELRTYGFKSFAEPITLKLERGITGFVGPNGSGKSNVVDAIRWALGEQSAKELRATLHEDLIFDGTAKRPPSNLASVSIRFTNDGELPLNFTEIEIERKIYKSGESQYLINKENVRLKDVQHLLAEIGMGTKTYSLFKQSLIEDIVNDKVDALRNLLEESAGITIYKNSKKETLRKLIASQENLNRINDLIMEIEKNEKELKKQANRTKKFFELKNIYQNLSQNFFSKRVTILDKTISELDFKIKEKDETVKGFHETIRDIKKVIEEKREEKNQIDDEIELKSGKKEELKQKLYEYKESISVWKERISGLQKQIEDKNEFKKRITEELPLKNEKLAQIRSKKENLTTRIEKIKKEKEAEFFGYIEQVYRDSENTYFEISGKAKKIDNELILLKSRMNTTKTGIEYEDKIFDEKNKELELETEKYDKSLKDLKELDDGKNRLENILENLKRELDSIEKEKEKISDEEKELNKLKEKLNRERIIEFTKLQQLEERERETRESFKDIVNLLETDVEIVRNLVKPHKGFEKLVETALSLILNSIVLNREQLEKIKNKNTPYVQIVLNDFDHINNGSENTLEKFLDAPDFLKNYFSNFKVVDFYEDKLLSENGYIVTKDGFLITPDKIFVKSGEIKILNFVQEINNLKDVIEKLDQELSDVEKKLEISRKNLKDVELIYEAKKIENSDHQNRYNFLIENIKAVKRNIEAKDSYIKKLKEKMDETLKRKKSLENEITELQGKIDLLEKEKETSVEDLKRVESDFYSKKEEYIIYKNKKDEMENILKDLLKEEDNFNQEENELIKTINLYSNEITNYDTFYKNILNEINKYENQINSKESIILDIEKEIEKMDEEISQLLEKKDFYEELIKENEEKEEELRNLIEQINRENEELKIEKERMVIEKNNFEEKIDRSFEIDNELIEKYKETEEEEIKYLEEKIKNFGPVNELAFQEYTETSRRLEEILKQKEDILQSKENLEKTIKTLDAKAKLLFSQYFDTIRVSFKELFSEIYKQGKADIVLQDEEHPLESEINIIFEPGEKKIGKLIKLSEGERCMMVIILLFAMYLVKPTPVCIMDEIDRALDDANVENFINLLKRFREKTQFILITHNKRTMEFCDFLFGVTMEESGVTNIFSLNLQTISERFLKDAIK